MKNYCDLIERELIQLEKYLLMLETKTPKPFRIIDNETVRGFRYGKPSILNYIIINIANSISTIRSIIILFECGFNTQASMLIRFLIEQETKLSFVIGGISIEGVDKKSQKFIDEYFSDNIRDGNSRSPYKPISQKDIHRRNSEKITRDIKELNELGIKKIENKDDYFAKLKSSMYGNFSNYIHGRYPEMMDIFGEKSLDLKMNGNNESKDIDAEIEFQFLHQMACATKTNLKLAFLTLSTAKIIRINNEEKLFATEGVF